MKPFSYLAFAIALSPIICVAEEAIEPIDQNELNAMVAQGDPLKAFLEAFEAGDELTEFRFTAEHGVGANIGEGRRFTRFPRADLDGPKEWATHIPKREGGANATSCIACHNAPFANGAGDIALNVVVDPAHTGDPSKYLERNTLPLFALGIPQRLAEEISLDLYAQRDMARARACEEGQASANLKSKGVDYGVLGVNRISNEPCAVTFDTSALDGIDADLVIRPFGWKGNHATIRAFTRGAAHNELGLQAVELVGSIDGDYDGVTDELSVGDMTALTTYMAALERPVTRLELADLGLDTLSPEEKLDILAGDALFTQVGCASCHTPSMTLDEPIFSEPSNVAGFFDAVFPDGSKPEMHGLTQQSAIAFDLSKDQPNNIVVRADGTEHHLGALETENGAVTARWFTDFKRHDMGPELSDPSDPLGLGAAKFLTRSLAGVGVTGPWLHDGRATTLDDAIRMHGGAAAANSEDYAKLTEEERNQLVAFLENQVMYHDGEE